MKIARIAKYSVMAFILGAMAPGRGTGQSTHNHAGSSKAQQLTKAQGALLQAVRESTARFKDVSVAEAEGYSLLFGCVTGPDWGAMGLHYVNMSLVGSGVVDATQAPIVIYEPRPHGPRH